MVAARTVLEALSRQELQLLTRGSGPPPTSVNLDRHELAPCSFCRLPLLDLGCSHLFCPRCKIFESTPPLLQWETAGGKKAPCAPVCNNEAQAAGPSIALPFEGCLTSTCSGNPQLTGPWFFPMTWGDTQELPEALQREGGGPPAGPPCLIPWLGPDLPQELAGSEFCTPPVSPALAESVTGGSTPPLIFPSQTVQSKPSQSQGRPVSIHKALLTGQRCPQAATRRGVGRNRSAARASLWAATRKQRTEVKERRTRRSNASFWKRWSPEAWDSPSGWEVVDPTPHAPAVPARSGDCKSSEPYSPADGRAYPVQAVRRPRAKGYRRQRRPSPKDATAAQLHDLATLLKSKVANDPELHSAAIACADWVESQGLPEEALESQLVWQVLEHCSGTPGPLDLPTLAAFADIAIEAQAPGQPKPLTLAIANITKWRQEILQWFQQTGSDCLLAQETHLDLDQVQQAKSALLTAGLHSFWAGATPENRTKGGLVVATPWQTHPRLVHSFTIEGCGFLAVELPRVRWRLVVISVYLQSGIGLSAEPNATILAHLLALVQTLPNWVAAGDWNVDLDKFASTNIATEAKGQLLGSKEAAISTGNTLDFVLASRSVAGLLRLRVEEIVPFAPHFCLKLEVDVGQGLLNLPALKGFSSIQSLLNSEKGGPAPARFPATSFEETGDSPLPVRTTPDSDQGGTETQQPPRKLVLNIGGVSLAPTAATCGFAAFSCSVELELLGKAYGRGAHNPVEYKPVLRDDRQATRWHARPNAILAQIMRIAKLLEAQQPPPTELLELARQYLAEEEALETSTPAWAEVLGISCDLLPAALPILSQRQVTSLVDGLQQEINLSKLRVSRRSRDSYSRWLQGSSEGGLKPLFRCIRKYEASVERPFPSFSAASKLLLRLQQWSQLWKSSGSKPDPCFEDLRHRAIEQARALPAITGERVAQYMSRAPLKAPGPDGWTPHLMRALTAAQCQRLALIMREAELSGNFPEQWHVSLVVLLPKSPEIERPIALMHVLLKSWMKLRWSLLEQWQQGFASRGWWDSCGPGHSCLDVAVRRLIQYEASHTVQEHRITLYLDLSCFYETIIHSRLVEHAQGVDFPPLLLWGAIGAYRGPRLLTADGLVAPPAYASRGVLAGCPIAVALSKVALWPACHAVLNQPAVSTADTWVDDLSVDFCGPNPQQVAAKGLRVARSLFGALAEEGLEVSLKKTTWIASSPAVEAALKKQSQGEATQVSSVAKDLGVANAAGRARRTQVQSIRLRKGFTRGTRLQTLRVNSVAHRVRVSKMGSLSAAIWGHQGLGISPKQLRGLRSQAALAGRKQQLGSLDVVFSLGEGNCSDPLRTVILQHWRTLHKLLFAHPTPEQYQRLWKITWTKLASAPKRWALVKGPVAAMVAYLQDLGVDASDPASWRFPPGSLQGTGLWNFEKDTVSVAPGLSSAHRVEEALCRVLQYRANLRISQQDAGAGAQCGIDWSVPRKLLRKQAKRTNQLTALRMVWQGAFFTTVKGAKRQCPLCKKHADLRHVLLECQWWRGKGPSPPPHWHKLQQKWPAASLWLRGLPPASYVAFPALTPDLLLPRLSGIWQAGTSVKAEGLVFGTDATGTTNDQRTRVVAAAVVACTLKDGLVTEVGRITQVLPPGTSVVQGEALALALLLRHTTGQIEVTADCRPAILQAGSSTFRAAHANVWEDVWEDRHRLQITWHPSHRTPKEYAERYQACKEAAEAVPWRQHAGSVAQLDELVEEVNHFLASRAWTLLAGPVAPPLDVKPRHKSKGQLPPKRKSQAQPPPKPPQAQNRPAPGGGANKKQRLETLLGTAHLHGHCFAWSHTNPNNHSLKCSTCSLFIQQVHPTESFNRLEAQPCAHRPVTDLGKFGLHQSHSFYNMGAVLLCTKCFAVHKPGQLTPFKVVQEPCEGASRAHTRRNAYWAQRYLAETTKPATLFGSKGVTMATAKYCSEPARPNPLLHKEKMVACRRDSAGSMGCGPHTQHGATPGSAPTTEPESAEKPGSLQSLSSNPACVPFPLPSFPQPPCGEVLQETPGLKLCSRPGGSLIPPKCGPTPKPQPKAQPKAKAKSRKDPQPSSQPKLAQFFVVQTRKASTSHSTQGSLAHPTPLCPKSSPCQPGPSQPRPPKPKAD